MSTCWVILPVMYFFKGIFSLLKLILCICVLIPHLITSCWRCGKRSHRPPKSHTHVYTQGTMLETLATQGRPCALAMHCTPSPLYLIPHFQCENEQASIRVCRSCVVRWPHTMPVNMDRGPKSCQSDHELRATDTKALCPKSKFMHGQCAQLNSFAGLGHL